MTGRATIGKPIHIGNPHGYPDYSVPIIWVAQDGQLWPITDWVSHQGVEKLWRVTSSLVPGGSATTTLYTVPAGKIIYVVRYTPSATVKGYHYLQSFAPAVHLYDLFIGAYGAFNCQVVPPVTLVAGKLLMAYHQNNDAVGGDFSATVQAFELDA